VCAEKLTGKLVACNSATSGPGGQAGLPEVTLSVSPAASGGITLDAGGESGYSESGFGKLGLQWVSQNSDKCYGIAGPGFYGSPNFPASGSDTSDRFTGSQVFTIACVKNGLTAFAVKPFNIRKRLVVFNINPQQVPAADGSALFTTDLTAGQQVGDTTYCAKRTKYLTTGGPNACLPLNANNAWSASGDDVWSSFQPLASIVHSRTYSKWGFFSTPSGGNACSGTVQISIKCYNPEEPTHNTPGTAIQSMITAVTFQ
jgi:hypothetical protein